MEIHKAEFISSITQVRQLPEKKLPEFAFIGRSNVGKSSLINMLTKRKGLAKVSNTPGKTQTINHYLIDDNWYLVDLPGYGYASTSKSIKEGFGKIIENYVLKSESLFFLFILVDIRLAPQKNDLSFMEWAGSKEIPLGIIFTKADKLSTNQIANQLKQYKKQLLTRWDELPTMFITSSTTKGGREDVLTFIGDCLVNQKKN
jgi:GTP-binding protein